MKVADHSGQGDEVENVVREGSSNHPPAAFELRARGKLHLGQQTANSKRTMGATIEESS